MLFINVIQEEVRNGRCLGNGRLEGNVAERILTVHRNKSSSAIWNKSLDFIKRFLNSRFSGKIEIRSLWGGGVEFPWHRCQRVLLWSPLWLQELPILLRSCGRYRAIDKCRFSTLTLPAGTQTLRGPPGLHFSEISNLIYFFSSNYSEEITLHALTNKSHEIHKNNFFELLGPQNQYFR